MSIVQIVALKFARSVYGINFGCKGSYPLSPFASDEYGLSLASNHRQQTREIALEARPEFYLAARSGMQFHPVVRRLKSIVALVLAAVWLPASSHAFLLHFGFIHQVHAHDEQEDFDHDGDSEGPHEHNANNHPAADGRCLTPTDQVQAPVPAFVVMADWLAVSLVAPLMDANFATLHSGLSPPGVAPPELVHRWQFYFRAALPVRAPSFVS